MIRTYRYGGEAIIEKNGQKQTVQIPPRVALNQMGPFIEVAITHPASIQEQIKLTGKKIETLAVRALIDTGASCSIIAPKVADQLGLVHTGYQKITSVQDEQERPVYYGMMLFPWGMGKEIPLVSCPLKHFDCLIGRDILIHWYFTYNGVDGSITICD